jgi:hypothetical protein
VQCQTKVRKGYDAAKLDPFYLGGRVAQPLTHAILAPVKLLRHLQQESNEYWCVTITSAAVMF